MPSAFTSLSGCTNKILHTDLTFLGCFHLSTKSIFPLTVSLIQWQALLERNVRKTEKLTTFMGLVVKSPVEHDLRCNFLAWLLKHIVEVSPMVLLHSMHPVGTERMVFESTAFVAFLATFFFAPKFTSYVELSKNSFKLREL